MKIGIVDSGVLATHEDLAGKVVDCAGVKSFGIDLLGLFTLPLLADPTLATGRCADDNGHGTHVAGIAAARANNGRGIAGIAFNSPLAVCKALDRKGAGAVAGIANCIGYLAGTGAKVISLSLGIPDSSIALRNAVAAASQSALIVAAAGNSGATTAQYPAGYPEVVSVAATDHRDRHPAFSTANAKVEIAAPGVDIISAWRDGGYRAVSGPRWRRRTSPGSRRSSPVATRRAGRRPGGRRFDAAVDDLGPAGRDPQFGFGRVNLPGGHALAASPENRRNRVLFVTVRVARSGGAARFFLTTGEKCRTPRRATGDALSRRQGGAVSRGQLVALGVDDQRIHRLDEQGWLAREHQGVYRVGALTAGRRPLGRRAGDGGGVPW